MSLDPSRYERLVTECEADRALWTQEGKDSQASLVVVAMLIAGGMSAALGAMLLAIIAL